MTGTESMCQIFYLLNNFTRLQKAAFVHPPPLSPLKLSPP